MVCGLFYFNPDDSDVFVPKRFTPDFTLNFARPVSKVCVGILIAMILLTIALAILAPGLASHGCHPPGCHLTP